MRNEEYKPIQRDDRTKRMKRANVDETKRIKTRPLKWKALRPDAADEKRAPVENPEKKGKQTAPPKPLPRTRPGDMPAMDALIRKSEAEQLRKRREAEKRRREARAKSPVASSSNRKEKEAVVRAQNSATGLSNFSSNPAVSRMTIAVGTVAFLLLVLWFSASFFIDAMSERPRGNAQESSAQESVSQASESSSVLTSSASQEESGSEEIPKPVTEGKANNQKPDTWIGKTFLVEDSANVRSDGGTQNPVLFTVKPGEKFIVKQAKMVDDAAWVQGIAVKADGSKQEGWIYSYCLDRTPQ
ncbi:SH3 domain-containing protein [Murdochiella vaginalis]|uniref:SH3 domain-containing protein n=1 Tax=Murdochiella vaginalis TaxID=1852373 RepID=UPI0008FE30E0|nr:SH3 domain-containing protein [Murdochiella vaginalis]